MKDPSKKMPETVTAAFYQLDEELNLDPQERTAAQQRHREISECLSEAGLAATTFLQGSFARKTMLKPLKDVDMVIVLPDAVAADLQAPGGPARAMAMLRRAVNKVSPARRSTPTDQPPTPCRSRSPTVRSPSTSSPHTPIRPPGRTCSSPTVRRTAGNGPTRER